MKTRYAVAVVASGLALAATLFAAEQRTAKALPNVIKLKADGEVVAEMRFYKDFKIQFLKQEPASGGAPRQMTIEITPKGDSPITVRAEEIDLLSDR
jgi:hypothetical protein